MSKQVTSSVVSILTQDQSTIAGSGILVPDNRVLTTAEVIGVALAISPGTPQRPENEVFVELPLIAPKKPLKAKIVHWLPVSAEAPGASLTVDNIAVLELLELPPSPGSGPEVMRKVPTNTDYKMVVNAITEGTLIPFFGAGVNLCGRPRDTPWRRGQFLPSGQELAVDLANWCGYPWSDTNDLLRVAQYAVLMAGQPPLTSRLRQIFDANYPPTALHHFFARLPGVLRKKGYPAHQLIVTTNYDDVLERAFREENEPYDLITYMAHGNSERRGKFLHWTPEGEVKMVDKPNEYSLPLDKNQNLMRSTILKLHGAVDRVSGLQDRQDSFVITEDHYIDYLTRSDISSLVPVTLSRKLRFSSFLFLGYSLRDWNLRVILYRIWMEQQQNGNYKSWAIQLDPEELETKMWEERDVQIAHAPLDDYIAELNQRVASLPPSPAED